MKLKFAIFFNLIYIVYSSNPLCAGKNASCSYQLWPNDSTNSCYMVFYKLNTSCDEDFTIKSNKNNADSVNVKLEHYTDFPARTAFKITLYNITWKRFKMRFKLRDVLNICMKKEFYISKIVPTDKYLTYDGCPWSDAIIEGKIVDFEFAFGDKEYEEYRKYSILVPFHNHFSLYSTSDISKLKLFVYVDSTDLYRLVLKMNTPVNLNIATYQIYVNRTNKGVTSLDGPFIVSVAEFAYDTYGLPGEYSFQVTPESEYCQTSCTTTESATVYIPNSSTVLCIGIVGISCVIPIFLLILYKSYKQHKVVQARCPNILLISNPGNNAHEIVGRALAEYLQISYQANVMIDFMDIPNSLHKNPLEWLISALDKASHIIILQSNTQIPSTKLLYPDLNQRAIDLIETSYDKTKHYCTFKFPYSDVNPHWTIKRIKQTFQFTDRTTLGKFTNFLHKNKINSKLNVKQDTLFANLLETIKSIEINYFQQSTNNQMEIFIYPQIVQFDLNSPETEIMLNPYNIQGFLNDAS